MKKDFTYYDLLRIVHDKVPSHVSFLLMLKLDFTNNIIFYILSYFLRFNGILLLCSDFHLTLKETINDKSIVNYLHYFTSYFLMDSLKITNFIYNAISIVIFILFCFRISIYFMTISKIKKRQKLEELKLSKYQVFMDHLVFLLYPFLLEFLVQLLYSYLFPNTFLFKKDQSKFLNILITILNIFLIIGYNINNYFYLILINRPFYDRQVPIKYNYSNKKFSIIFFLQNIVLVQNISKYFYTDKQFTIYSYCYLIFFSIVFFILFFMSLNSFNYRIFTNHFVSTMAAFSFFSMIVEFGIRILGYSIKTYFTLVAFNICKLIISCYFEYLNNNISEKALFSLAKKELFKVNKHEIRNNNIYDVFLYILDIIRNIKYNNHDISSVNLLNTIFEHQNKCTLNNCKCKLLQILPHGEQYDKNYNFNLIERIGFLIESSFIQLDFGENYDLTLVLSEHFYLLKDNPIMAYSLIQTLLFNSSSLSIENYLILYETCQKYIETSLDYDYLSQKTLKSVDKDLIIKTQDQLSHDILREKNFRNIFLIYDKILKIQSMMNDYIQIVIDLMKKKSLVEESVKIKKNEDSGEILWIDFIYLDSKNIEEIIKSLKKETYLNRNIYDEILKIKTTKLPMEFYYKMFIFCETFWEGKIDEKVLPIFYSFTNDHNLYSSKINPNIFILLRQRFIDLNNQGASKHYCIFKYSKGMSISYFSEPLSQYLGFLQSEIIDKNIEILFPNDLVKPHDNLIAHYLITQQNRIYKNINNRMFNKKGLSVDSIMEGASLPGLGKNLLIIVNIKMIENENDYFLYYNQNLELISISNNFSKYFNIDTYLINKFNVDLLSIFNLSSEFIKKKLNDILPIINEYKYNLNIMTGEIFTKKLFKQINKFNNIKYKILEEIESINLDESENNLNNKLLKAQKCLEKIYNNKISKKVNPCVLFIKKLKSSIYNNFNKYSQKKNDKIDYNDKSYLDLIDSFLLFFNYQNNNINDSNNMYHFYIKLEILYDIPFILIKFNEVGDSSIININKDFLLKRKLHNINDNYENISITTSVKGDNNTKTPTNETRDRSMTSALTKMLNFQRKIKINQSILEKHIKEIIFIFICCVLCVYIIILIYQLDVVKNCYNIFLAFYYNYIQRDRLVNLHSSIFSGYYYYADLVDYSDYIPIHQYQDYIVENAQKFSNSYHVFYEYYIKYRFSQGKDLSALYHYYNISKITVNWDEIKFISNYMTEAENIVHISTISSISDTLNNIKNDINNFFNSKFKNLSGKDRKLQSEYAWILYYFSANMEDSYIVFFENIQNEISNTQSNYSSSSRLICALIEIIGFLANILTLSLCIKYLKNSNNNIYKDIANLFIDFTQEEAYTFKNNKDNYIILEKLLQLKFLINNFCVKAIDKYNKKVLNASINIIEDNRIDKSIISKDSSNKGKKILNEKENKKKHKNSKDNVNITNNTTNNSIINSKTQGKLLSTNSINIISKLNQNIYNNGKSNISKNSLIKDSSIQNLSINKKNEEEDNDILTSDKIDDKIKTIEIKLIQLNLWIIIFIIMILVIYTIVKIIMTINYIYKIKQAFKDYSIVTFEYSMIINYFNNLELILMNQQFGKEDVLNQMQVKIEAQFKQSEEVKKKSIQQYPNVHKLFSILNNEEDQEKLKSELCQTDFNCLQIFDSKYNIVKNGIDVGLKTVAQVIYDIYKDFLLIKDKIDEIGKIKTYFINEYFRQIDMSLNFLFVLVEDRCADAFIIDCNELIKTFNTIIISFNIFIIIFLALCSTIITLFIIGQLTKLSDLIDKSTVRLCTSIFSIKEKNIGYKIKTSSIL